MSNLVEYVKWSVNVNDEQFDHIGVLTQETESTVSILTKHGEMTIQKDDGQFSESTREEFEQVVVEVPKQEEQIVVTVKSGTKSEKALSIFLELNVDGKQRKSIMDQFKSQLGMENAGASTYYQNIKTKLGIK
jgi:hypothetical protein